jgi:hypothetical protein
MGTPKGASQYGEALLGGGGPEAVYSSSSSLRERMTTLQWGHDPT